MAKVKKKCCEKVQKKGKCCKRCPLFVEADGEVKDKSAKAGKKKKEKKEKKKKKKKGKK